MFLEILSMEGDTMWEYGPSSKTAYPLAKVWFDMLHSIVLNLLWFCFPICTFLNIQIDTINETNGGMNEESVLSLVVYGVSGSKILKFNFFLNFKKAFIHNVSQYIFIRCLLRQDNRELYLYRRQQPISSYLTDCSRTCWKWSGKRMERWGVIICFTVCNLSAYCWKLT